MTTTQSPSKAQIKQATDRFRVAHHRALETLRAPDCERSGLELWRKLARLETIAHACATASCNGERIQVRWPIGPRDRELMLREYDFNADENAWDRVSIDATDCVRNVFGRIPDGFFVNGDARGYALKLDPDKTPIPEGMHTDWGRNGILAAQIDDNT